MLSRLCVKNLALIEQLDMELEPGFTVMTGETGAGKSIIIDAVNLVLGGRADRDLIKSGEEKAAVEAVFAVEKPSLIHSLLERGVETEEDTLIFSRELSISGRNTCRINGRLSGVSLMRDASELLVDIHGQHDHQSLLNANNHLKFLDDFGKSQIERIKSQVESQCKAWRELKKKLDGSWGSEAEREREGDSLRQQISEIDEANLNPGEETSLIEEYNILANSELIIESLSSAFGCISGSEDDEGMGVLQLIKSAEQKMESIAEFDPKYGTLHERLRELYYQMDDCALDLRNAKDDTSFDPYRYQEIEQRLVSIEKLKRKYGSSIDEILDYRNNAKIRLDELEEWRLLSEDGQIKLSAIEDELYESSKELSDIRRAVAKSLAESLKSELLDLGMDKTRFAVRFSAFPEKKDSMQFHSDGLDDVEMQLSTNPGEPLKPLQKVASGGELSRIMLAFKSVFAELDSCDTLIFDEIDTGISGRIAAVVGQKMRNIARNRQVICVTHSAQVAALADTHYLIEKSERNDRTYTNVRKLDSEEHVLEVARIISGEDADEQAIAHARSLVAQAQKHIQ